MIRNYLSWEWPGYTLEAVPTYGRGHLSGLADSARAAGRLMRASNRAVVHVHLSQRGSFIREGGLASFARLRGLRTVATIHGSTFPEFARRHASLVGTVLGACEQLIVLNDAALEAASTYVDRHRIAVVPNAVRVPHIVLPPGDKPMALFGGEMGVRKGVDVLLAAWPAVVRLVPTARLHLAGPDPNAWLPGELPPGAEYLGPISHPQMQAQLQEARVAVLPSRAEGLPMFILEAMSQGRPVVATPVGGIATLIGTGGGTVVPVGDAEALSHALGKYLSDHGLAESHGRAAHARIRESFHAEAHRDSVIEVYRRLDRGSG